jgi:hypothetical protein
MLGAYTVKLSRRASKLSHSQILVCSPSKKFLLSKDRLSWRGRMWETKDYLWIRASDVAIQSGQLRTNLAPSLRSSIKQRRLAYLDGTLNHPALNPNV